MTENKVLGIDVGSVAVGVAVVSEAREVLASGYAIHKGEIETTLTGLLADIDLKSIDHVVATASTPSSVRVQQKYNNEVSFITAAKQLHLDVERLLLVGGEKFSLARFDSSGHYLGSKTNTSCAAGTGSFLDQQATRLNLGGIEELSAVACASKGECPRIASRCAVFAKTDLIHAQQEGYTLDEISDGLCRGLAKNLIDTLFTAEDHGSDILFCGGVAKNAAVAEHIEKLTGARLTIPENGHLYGAIGSCCLFWDEQQEKDVPSQKGQHDDPADVFAPQTFSIRHHYHPPLSLSLSEYPEFASEEQYVSALAGELAVEVDIYRVLVEGEIIHAYLGIDIGSTSTKAVLMDSAGEVVAGFYTRTAGRPLAAVQAIFRAVDEIRQEKGVEFHVIQCGTTGSGRKFIGKIIGADIMLDEITAHARAAYQLNPEVDTIIEIGGQDAKFTTLQNGRVTSSIMNTVCAAGTGSFIEEQASKLGCSLSEYSSRAENTRAPMVSDRCTVFMERDMNHYLSEGYTVDEVLASALHAVRENYLLKVAVEKHIGNTVFFQGATARNKALVAAFEQRLKRPILVSKFCHLTGALGTALTLCDEKREATSFVGFELYRESVPITSEVCDLCTNHCKISVADVCGSQVAYGFLCGRDYQTKSFVKVDSTAFDLLGERRKLLRQSRSENSAGPVIGLPAAVHLVEDLPMWHHFFTSLGVRVLTSEKCTDGVQRGKNIARAEFCAPVTAMHGHVDWLLERADFVFLPTYLEEKAKDVRRQYCYYTQYLPALGSMVDSSGPQRILRPVVRYLYTTFHAKMQLYRMMQEIEQNRWSFLDISTAFDNAMQVQKEGEERLKRLFRESRGRTDDIEVVLIGRPYTVLSPGMNANIPGIFQKLGVNAYYQDMLEYDSEEVAGLQPLLDELHWKHPVNILEVTEVVAKRKNLYPVFLTSFMCTPDSFTMDYFKSIMDKHKKPYLVLQLDEHDSSVGYETRIEAAIRAFRNHSSQKLDFLPVNYSDVNPDLDTELNRKHVIFPNWDHITSSLLASTLRGEGFDVYLMEETDQTIRESLKHNSGQCIPLNAVAQGYMQTMKNHGLKPADCVLWLNESTLACNIRLYPHHIKQILIDHGLGEAGVYVGQLSLAEISIRAAMNAYFAYMIGGMLRKVVCRIRPYEVVKGETEKVLNKGIQLLSAAFAGRMEKEDVLKDIVSRFSWIETEQTERPKVAIFGDLYVRDNRVMNQDLIRFIEENGGEVITTPYSEYAKMIAPAYFRKWFNEGKFFNLLTYKALLATMQYREKNYARIFKRILDEVEHAYSENPTEILAEYGVAIENTGETMDNFLKIHYIKKYYPDVALFVQTSPALCCPSLITEAMKEQIEKKTGAPVVSVTYDGTGGRKNDMILPYLKYPFQKSGDQKTVEHTSRVHLA